MLKIPQKLLNIDGFKEELQNLLENFEEQKYLLAISGGVDSMVLLNLFKNVGLQFQVAHVNYKLRGEDSELDQKLVEEFCAADNIKFHLYEVSEVDKKPENSIQNWARNLRYDFFRKIQNQENLKFLVTAHHLNDQLETFIINLSKSAGIKGLIGIPSNENGIIRPLLNFSKEKIYEFARTHKIEFREDSSNEKNDYLRNKIRNTVLPEFQNFSPDFLNQFGASLTYLKAANNYIQNNIDESFRDILIEGDENFFILNKEKLLQKDHFIIAEIIRKLGFSGIEIEKVISAENGKFFRSKTHEIKISKKEIYCEKKSQNKEKR